MLYKKILSIVVVFGLLFSLACSSTTKKDDDYNFSKDDVVTLYGTVNATTAASVIDQLKKIQDKSTKPIYFFIDSPGGEVFQGTKIIDAMLASKRPIYTVDIGMAASMAAFIHSYGTKRFMLPHAIIMFHNASGSFEGEASKMQSRMTMLALVMGDFNNNVVKRTGVTLDELQAKENVEWWILSGEALQRHFVDGIATTLDFPVTIPPESKESE